MTRKSLRNLLNRAARLLEAAARAQHGPSAGDAHRIAKPEHMRVTARELRDAAAKGISA